MDVRSPELQLKYSIIDPGMTVKAMRDSGYKSTTHALAELIDNSIESGASEVEVFGTSQRHQSTGRYVLSELAVLDNGEGMDGYILRGSLRYGHGTRRNGRGIGRFGLGLPNSSLSQARRVDVWSWKSGVTNALHTYLSLDEVEAGATEISDPTVKEIPFKYRDASRCTFEDSGTLVVWSDLDRIQWKQASTTFKHTEHLIGRIYRRFLAKQSDRLHKDDPRGSEMGEVRNITLIPLLEDNSGIQIQHSNIVEVRPNDPLYLMSNTSCPQDFGPGPMFEELEGSPFSVPVQCDGVTYEVRVRASYVRRHARVHLDQYADWPENWRGQDAGNTPWGKHANGNLGISVVRAHREILLDESWVNQFDTRERWWKVEIDFPTELDELFGVTNNKQGTITFERLAYFDWKREQLIGEKSAGDVRRRMEQDGDDRVYLLDLRKQIDNALRIMRAKVRARKKDRTDRHEESEEQKADAKATSAIKRRQEEGHQGESDRSGVEGTEADRRKEQLDSLTTRHQLDRIEALQRIEETLQTGNRVRWIESAQPSPAFFEVESLPNVIQVALNTKHPVHSHLYDILHPDVENLSEEDLRSRLEQATAAFRILIYAWARYEDEQTERDQRQVRNSRIEWGKYAEEFFDDNDDSIPPINLV